MDPAGPRAMQVSRMRSKCRRSRTPSTPTTARRGVRGPTEETAPGSPPSLRARHGPAEVVPMVLRAASDCAALQVKVMRGPHHLHRSRPHPSRSPSQFSQHRRSEACKAFSACNLMETTQPVGLCCFMPQCVPVGDVAGVRHEERHAVRAGRGRGSAARARGLTPSAGSGGELLEDRHESGRGPSQCRSIIGERRLWSGQPATGTIPPHGWARAPEHLPAARRRRLDPHQDDAHHRARSPDVTKRYQAVSFGSPC